jgi:hypothetical protein
MPDLEDGTSDAFGQGRIIGRQEERAKIKRIFHETVSPELSVALRTLAEAEKELKAKHAPEERRTPVHRLRKLERSRIWRVAAHLQIYTGEPNELVAQLHPRMPGDSSSSNITQCG